MGNAHRASPPPPPPPPPPPVYYYGPPSQTVSHMGRIYGVLDHYGPYNFGIGCQSGYYVQIPSGWAIAPNDANSRFVAGNYAWGTHVVGMSDGCFYGTSTYTHGSFYGCYSFPQYGGGYSVPFCSARILISMAAPTQSPTPFPIAKPSPFPLANPTAHPVADPTAYPIASPTFVPTLVPTAYPIAVPSEKPIPHPTQSPSFEPTFEPTVEPTHTPTEKPSCEPTQKPSLEPTVVPSRQPTTEPSKEPIAAPTENPTLRPTPLPSFAPTTEPSLAPSFMPTLEPTAHPTQQPSEKPSAEPTREPTLLPTTWVPRETMAPTESPTTIPYEGKGFCTFEFKKTENNVADLKKVAPGCVVITVDDLDYLEVGMLTRVAYVCTTADIPLKVTLIDLKKGGLDESISNIIPGKDATCTIYTGSNFNGLSKSFTDKWHPSLASLRFANSNVNDATESFYVESTSKSLSSPSYCFV